MENDFIKIEDAFKKAPAKIKEALLSTELSETLQKIMEENKISSENADRVTDETGAVLLGLSPRESILISIEKNTGMAKELVLNIAKEIEEKIFKNVLSNNTNQESQGGEIVLENQNPFLPMLNKIIDNKTADNRRPDIKEEEKIPNVTSALAAEIGNLLGKTDDRQQTTDNKIDSRQQTADDRQSEKIPLATTPTVPKIGVHPMDKMAGLVHQPKVEVEMIRSKEQQTLENRQAEKKGDPYRETIG